MATASDKSKNTATLSRWLVGALCAAIAIAACEERAPAPRASHDPGAPDQVERVVRDVVESMHAHDCARLEPLIDGPARARMQSRGGCARIVETEPASMDLELVRMDEPRRDGRDPNAWIVPVVLRADSARQSLLMRVQRRDGRYRVVAM